MRKRLLHLVALMCYRAPWLVLAVVAALTLAALHLSLQRLTVSPDLTLFLPEDLEEVVAYNTIKAEFGSFNYILAIFQTDRHDEEGTLRFLADRFAEALARPDLIASVDYKIDIASYYDAASLDRRALHLLTHGDWQTLEQRLAPASVDQHLAGLLALLQMSEPNRPVEELLEEPFGVFSVFRRRIFHTAGPIDQPVRDGYLLSEDGRKLILVIRPQKASTNHQFSTALQTFLERAREGVRMRNADLWDQADARLDFIGSHMETSMSANLIRQDLAATSIIALAGVMLLFLLAFRRLLAVALVALSLLVGVAWTVGLTALIYGYLTTVTFSLSAVLLGLGIDFAIHIYNRFAEEVERTGDSWLAMDRAIVQTGEGILIAALTTATAFFGLVFAGSPGFKELGVIGGLGILCCLASVYLTLPPLMLIGAQVWGVEPAPRRLASFGLSRLATLVMAYPRSTIILFIALTAYLAFHTRYVTFSRDWTSLTQYSDDYTRLKESVNRSFALSGREIVAVVTSDTLQGALEDNDRLFANLESLDRRQFPYLLSCDSLRSVLPSLATQRQSRERFAEIDLVALRQTIQASGARLGLGPATFDPFVRRLEGLQDRSLSEPAGINLMAPDAPRALIAQAQQYITKSTWPANRSAADNGLSPPLPLQYRVITHIYPRSDGWRPRPPDAFFAAVGEGIANVQFTGDSLLLSAGIHRELSHHLAAALLLIILAVSALIVLHFRSFRLALFAMSPVLCSLIWTLGLMGLLGLELNILNIIILPLIVGIGIDDGIHIIQRFFESRADPNAPEMGHVETAVRQTGRAVAVTSLTTMIGFGALAFAHFDGLREIGYISLMGIGSALVATLMLLPTMLRVAGPNIRVLNAIGQDRGIERESRND